MSQLVSSEIQEVPFDRLMDFFEDDQVVGQTIDQFASYLQTGDQPPRQQQETVITIQTRDGHLYQSKIARASPEPGRLMPVQL